MSDERREERTASATGAKLYSLGLNVGSSLVLLIQSLENAQLFLFSLSYSK
jgi:hypothetical protein